MSPAPLRSADVLATFQADLERVRSQVYGDWKSHDTALLTQRPAPRKWSAIDCLEHTRRANRLYIKPLEKALTRAEAKGQRPVETFSPSAMGARMRAKMQPQTQAPAASDGRPQLKLKLPTVGSADPTKDPSPPEPQPTLDAFAAQLDQMLSLARRAERVDLNRRVTGFFGTVLRLRIGDVLRYLIAHTDRHLVQAERAIDSARG